MCIAFDQAVTPNGHKERVTVGQIRSFVEMDSHDEKMAELDQEAKKRAVHSLAKAKEKELKEARDRAAKAAKAMGGGGIGPTAGSVSTSSQSSSPAKPTTTQPYVEARTPSRPSPAPAQASSVTGMVLGKKSAQKTLVDQIAKEELGRQALLPASDPSKSAAPATTSAPSAAAAATAPNVNHDSDHVVIEERIAVKALKDGTDETREV